MEGQGGRFCTGNCVSLDLLVWKWSFLAKFVLVQKVDEMCKEELLKEHLPVVKKFDNKDNIK